MRRRRRRRRRKAVNRKSEQGLASAPRKKSHEDSSSSKSDSEDEGLHVGKKHDLTSRQRKLRKLSSDHPGTLLVRGFGLMHEQLGTLYGDATATGSEAEALQPRGRHMQQWAAHRPWHGGAQDAAAFQHHFAVWNAELWPLLLLKWTKPVVVYCGDVGQGS